MANVRPIEFSKNIDQIKVISLFPFFSVRKIKAVLENPLSINHLIFQQKRQPGK